MGPLFHMNGRNPPGKDSADARFHLHRFDDGERLIRRDGLTRLREHLHGKPRDRSNNPVPIGPTFISLGVSALAEDEACVSATQMQVPRLPYRYGAAANTTGFIYDFRPGEFHELHSRAGNGEGAAGQAFVTEGPPLSAAGEADNELERAAGLEPIGVWPREKRGGQRPYLISWSWPGEEAIMPFNPAIERAGSQP